MPSSPQACICWPAYRTRATRCCIPGRDCFYKLHREPRARAVPGLLIYLVQSSLVFFNIDYVRDRIRWIVDRLPQSTRWFMLDAEAVTTIDSTAAAVLGEISEELSRRNLRFGVANLHRNHASCYLGPGFSRESALKCRLPVSKMQLSPSERHSDRDRCRAMTGPR